MKTPLSLSFLILLLFLARSTYGQQNELDSLLLVIRTLQDDTIKVRTYARISYKYHLLRSHDLARLYADSTKWLAEKLKYEAGIVSANYHYAMIEQFVGNYEKSIEYHEYCYNFYEKNKDSSRMAETLFGLGKVYKSQGDLDTSLKNFFNAAVLFDKLSDQKGLANTWNSMGGIYRQLKQNEEAIAYYNQSNAIYKGIGDTKNYAMGLQNLGNVYSNYENYDSAKVLYHRALELVRQISKPYEESIVLGNLGKLYNEMDQHDKALTYHLQALPIRQKIGNKRSIAIGLKDVAFTRMKLGQLREADIFIREALALGHEIHSKDLLREFYEVQADIAVAGKDFTKAYEYIRLSHQWKDSVFNEESSHQINELKAAYESEKKDKQIILLAKEKELEVKEGERQLMQKRAVIIGLILVSILAGVIMYATRQKMKSEKVMTAKNAELKEVNFKKQLSELEMKALRAQINPHFLFNCMNSINRMILNGDNENASLYLTKLSKLVRMILENTETGRVTLESELFLIESYIQMEELRFKGKIDYEIRVDESVEKNNTYLPPMVLQPFVENAIWHGLMHKEKDERRHIKIDVKENEDALICTIEDNGVGRARSRELQEKSVFKSKSMGIKITEERLKLLSKERLEELILVVDLKDVYDTAMGTRVEISIPLS